MEANESYGLSEQQIIERNKRIMQVIKAARASAFEQLILIRAKVHKIVAPDNERESSVHGYFLSSTKAYEFANNCGWFNAPGQVTIPDGMFTDGTDFYHVEKLKLIDVEEVKERVKQERINKIKAKLTPEEIELLGLGQAQM